MPLAKAAAKVMVGVSLAEQGYIQRADPAPRLGQGGRLPLRQVRRRRHRARAGDEIDRRGDGHQRAVLHRLCQEPVGRRHGAAHGRQGLHQRGRPRPSSTSSTWRGGWSRWASSCWPPRGTAAAAGRGGHPGRSAIKKLQQGHPNLLDFMIDGDLQLVINTPSGKGARTDEGRIRAAAVSHGIPCITTLQAADGRRRRDGSPARRGNDRPGRPGSVRQPSEGGNVVIAGCVQRTPRRRSRRASPSLFPVGQQTLEFPV